MSKPKIGAVTIGQSPRPDLIEPLGQLRPDVEIIEVGALDGLTAADLPDAAEASYPLKTRLRDGHLVTVPEAFLKPLIQQAVEAAEAQQVLATVLLCAGTFAEVSGVSRPLVKPFDTAVAVLNSMGVTHIGVLAPMVTQERPIRARWTAAGFDARVWTPPYAIDSKEFTGWLYRMMSN
ncbi:MAG: AroM family protein, partial [Anaerolineales bacterium]|nr:AroM family protein [Anaerolineales bacterium]